MTLRDLVAHCADRLTQASVSFGQGTLNAYDEAAWLVLWRLGLPLNTALSDVTQTLTEHHIQDVQWWLDKRIDTRQPLAYLTQEAWLQGVSFYVDERCLIPRSLIAETIANESFDAWLSPDAKMALDVCTGGGSLAILLALNYPQWQVDALDISPEALAVAQINVSKHKLQDRVRLFVSDGLDQVENAYDLIVCNPPYVNAHSMQGLPAEFQAEPRLALAGGEDGMDFIRPMVNQIARHLTKNGVLILEIGHEWTHFQKAFPWIEPVFLSTSAGEEHVLLITQQALLK